MGNKPIVTGEKGEKFEVQENGTLKKIPESSGGIIENLIDAGADVVGAFIPTPKKK